MATTLAPATVQSAVVYVQEISKHVDLQNSSRSHSPSRFAEAPSASQAALDGKAAPEYQVAAGTSHMQGICNADS